MANRNNLSLRGLLAGCLLSSTAAAYELPMNTAKMQAMDKITGRVSVIEAPVNREVHFGSFSIVVRSCKSAPPEETPENYAFVDVADTDKDGKLYNIFKGWMTSSSPALNAIEHPIYDVWLLQCVNKQGIIKEMTQAELSERDNLPKKKSNEKNETISKEAIKAAEAEAEAKAAAEEEKAAEELQAAISAVAESETVETPSPVAVEVIEDNTEDKVVEDGAPISLIPTLGNPQPQAEEISNPPAPTESSVSEEPAAEEIVSSEPMEAKVTDEDSVTVNSETINESVESNVLTPAVVLTEEDVLPTVDASEESAEEDANTVAETEKND